ncbi:MAG: hypothetical protein O9295_25425 [Microcystis sp. LE18-22.4A]|nr:hypothetical protein [Microcystis sp. LE18-22.4A]
MGKTPHPTPHTPHPAPTKNFFSSPYLAIEWGDRRYASSISHRL